MHLRTKIPIEFAEVVVIVFSSIWPAEPLVATSWLHLGTLPTSVMELFVEIVNGFSLSTIFAKRPDIWYGRK